MISDIRFIVPAMATAKTQAKLSDKPVYLMRWSVEDELNYMKHVCKRTDVRGKKSQFDNYNNNNNIYKAIVYKTWKYGRSSS